MRDAERAQRHGWPGIRRTAPLPMENCNDGCHVDDCPSKWRLAEPGPPWLRPRARTCKLREFGTRPTTRSDNMTGSQLRRPAAHRRRKLINEVKLDDEYASPPPVAQTPASCHQDCTACESTHWAIKRRWGGVLLRALRCALCHRSIKSDNPCLTCTAHVLEDNCLWGNVSLQTPSALPSHETRHTADDTEHSANSDAAVTETFCRTSFEVRKAGDALGSVIVSVTDFSSHAAGAWPHVADGVGMLSLHKPQGPFARKLPKDENRPLVCLAATANHLHPQNAL